MKVVLKSETKRVKNGYCVRAPELRLAAHGYNEEVARQNLQNTVRLYLSPFVRQGTVRDEMRRAGLRVSEVDDGELSVILE